MENRDINAAVPNWVAPIRPEPSDMVGKYVRLEQLSASRHAAAIYSANQADDQIWAHMPYGPFPNLADYCDWVESVQAGTDPVFYAIQDTSRAAWGGVASFLRISPEAGSIEVGHICLAPQLQRTRAATEAMYLMMKWAFEAGYRRYEWKCNAANIASRRAAQRFGFSFEGVFRQATIIKGRNRDTAWLAAIDDEWPALKHAFETWLDAGNFDADGRQIKSLVAFTNGVLAVRDPAL